MITVGCDRATSEAAIATAAAYPGVFATVGLHPHEAAAGVETITDLLDTPGIVAVGEAGLDYYYDHAPRRHNGTPSPPRSNSRTSTGCRS